MKNVIDYRTAELSTAAVCSECESLQAVNYSLMSEFLIECPSCQSIEMMINLTPRIVQLKKWRQQHLKVKSLYNDRIIIKQA